MNSPKIVLRINAANPNHHLWNNNGTWWCHYTINPTPFTKERIRASAWNKGPHPGTITSRPPSVRSASIPSHCSTGESTILLSAASDEGWFGYVARDTSFQRMATHGKKRASSCSRNLRNLGFRCQLQKHSNNPAPRLFRNRSQKFGTAARTKNSAVTKMAEPPADADFLVYYHGSNVVVEPRNSTARQYLETTLGNDALGWFNRALVIEDSLVVPVVHKLIAAGFKVV
jgi:hypothetical protein